MIPSINGSRLLPVITQAPDQPIFRPALLASLHLGSC